jgi:outer membrane phospholipase A
MLEVEHWTSFMETHNRLFSFTVLFLLRTRQFPLLRVVLCCFYTEILCWRQVSNTSSFRLRQFYYSFFHKYKQKFEKFKVTPANFLLNERAWASSSNDEFSLSRQMGFCWEFLHKRSLFLSSCYSLCLTMWNHSSCSTDQVSRSWHHLFFSQSNKKGNLVIAVAQRLLQ